MAQPGTKQGGEVDTLYSHSSSILCRNLHVFSPEPLMQNPDSLCKLDISANLHRLSSKPAMQRPLRSEEHTSELQSLMRISYAVFCLKKKKKTTMKNRAQTHKHYHTQD